MHTPLVASVKTVERQIGNLEGFDVVVRHPDGRDARSDLGSGGGRTLPPYNRFALAAKGTLTVAQWKKVRFSQVYSNWDCDVLDGAGAAVSGGTLLRTVRESYEGDG